MLGISAGLRPKLKWEVESQQEMPNAYFVDPAQRIGRGKFRDTWHVVMPLEDAEGLLLPLLAWPPMVYSSIRDPERLDTMKPKVEEAVGS